MDAAKIRLSPEEAALVINADWILTKNRILSKANDLLAMLQPMQQQVLLDRKNKFPEEVINCSPKISRGENYRGLPYLVLDYPRVFRKEDIFAIRSLFWWGHFFSCTILLSGSYKEYYTPMIQRSLPLLKENSFLLCNHESPWEHHDEADNYSHLSQLNEAEIQRILTKRSFVKIAKHFPLEDWAAAPEKLTELFSSFINMIDG